MFFKSKIQPAKVAGDCVTCQMLISTPDCFFLNNSTFSCLITSRSKRSGCCDSNTYKSFFKIQGVLLEFSYLRHKQMYQKEAGPHCSGATESLRTVHVTRDSF